MVVRGFLLSLIACFCLASECMGQNAASLNGNWLLTGAWDIPTNIEPRLTLTLGIVGEDMFGEGGYGAKGCGSGFVAQGKLAPDGTFRLTTSWGSITGTFDGSSSSWTGSYEATIGNACHSSGKFVAKRIGSPNGTYSGTLYGGINASLSLTTGSFTSRALPKNIEASGSVPKDAMHFTPITGTLRIDGLGSTKNTEIAAIEDQNNRLGGEGFIVLFPVKLGSFIMVTGDMRDGEASAVNVIATLYVQGKAAKSVAGTIVRQ